MFSSYRLKGEFLTSALKMGVPSAKTLERWNELSRILSGGEGDANDRVATQFLLNNYDAFESESAASTTKTKALSQYQRLLAERYEAGEDYLETLIKRARIYAWITRVHEDEDQEALDDCFLKLDKLESTQALPLLMYLMTKRDDLDLTDSRIIKISDALISFYVRRNVALTPKASNIRARLLGALRTLEKQALTGDAVVQLIRDVLRDMSVSDEQFKAALSQPLYDKNKKTARYLLIDIERRIGKSPTFDKGHPDSLDKMKKSKSGKVKHPLWSIEHIMPEGSLPACWIDELARGDAQEAESLQAEYVHLLGNLTLTPYNSELAQKPFYSKSEPEMKSKRDYRDPHTGAYVGLRSGLFLNQSIPDTAQGEKLETKKHWTVADIQRRNAELASYALALYRLP